MTWRSSSLKILYSNFSIIPSTFLTQQPNILPAHRPQSACRIFADFVTKENFPSLRKMWKNLFPRQRKMIVKKRRKIINCFWWKCVRSSFVFCASFHGDCEKWKVLSKIFHEHIQVKFKWKYLNEFLFCLKKLLNWKARKVSHLFIGCVDDSSLIKPWKSDALHLI